MSNLFKYTGDFYDSDYYERGKETGKGWLENYRWMPVRSYKEALAYVDTLNLNEQSRVLDIGCAKGFIVKALRGLDIVADGCDISDYALQFAPKGCWNSSTLESWNEHKNCYTHAISKDVLEHLNKEQLIEMLNTIKEVAPIFMCIVPMGDDGKYRIEEYHTEISHLIAENEQWWSEQFKKVGWDIVYMSNHIPGLKDNWLHKAEGKGNCVFILKRLAFN